MAPLDVLRSHGIDPRGKIVVVRYSNPYSYRGFKALTAEREGAAAMIVYSDPAEDGAARGPEYPQGPWGPASHLQRGGMPTSFDRMLATQYGAHAVRLVHEGRFGEMVCYRPPHITSVPIAEAVSQLATVDPQGSAVQAARALGIGFGTDATSDRPFGA